MTLVPFFAFEENAAFIATEYSVLMAFGGNDGETVNRTVYISKDYGRTWNEGGESVQLPDYMPNFNNSQAYVETVTFRSRSNEIWTEFQNKLRIPSTARIASPFSFGMSRATEPVTQWDCPYIYLYGAYESDGTLSPYIWRGTINRLTFKPIL